MYFKLILLEYKIIWYNKYFEKYILYLFFMIIF